MINIMFKWELTNFHLIAVNKRFSISDDISSNPGLAYVWEDESERRRMRGGTVEDMKPPQSPPRNNVLPSDSELNFRALFKAKVSNLVSTFIDYKFLNTFILFIQILKFYFIFIFDFEF